LFKWSWMQAASVLACQPRRSPDLAGPAFEGLLEFGQFACVCAVYGARTGRERISRRLRGGSIGLCENFQSSFFL
jgi:hypothetical protein